MPCSGVVASYERFARQGIASARRRSDLCLDCRAAPLSRRFSFCKLFVASQLPSILRNGNISLESTLLFKESAKLASRGHYCMWMLRCSNSSAPWTKTASAVKQAVKHANLETFDKRHLRLCCFERSQQCVPPRRSEYLQQRGVRTGFFRSDSDFNDPERALVS